MMVLTVVIFVSVGLFVPAYANASLLYCNEKDIRNYDLTTNTESVVVSGLHNAQAIDYHFEKNIVFWSDLTDKRIYSASLSQNGTLKTIIVDSVSSHGIAVDWFHDLLYWTNYQDRSIEVAKLDGSQRRTLIKRDDGALLRAIVLHPMEGFVFWCDVGSVPKIERCKMDGTNRSLIISENIRNPYCLAIDLESRMIFWIDPNFNFLNAAKFDGSHRRQLYKYSMTYYFLDVDHRYLYWASGSSVYSIIKEDGSNVTHIFTYSRNYKGVKVFSPTKQPADVAVPLLADISAEKRRCVQWFLDMRSNSSVFKWGRHLPRTAVALFLTDANYFAPENKTGQEIRYELTIHLLSTLNRHEILKTEKLALYVHALLVSCLNPYDFFRHDLVSELRKRVDNSKYTNPLAILVLCNAGAPMTDQDVHRLNETYIAQHRTYWTEVQVFSTMALACISSKTNVSVDQEVFRQWIDSAKDYPLRDETAINPRTVALIIQLMLSTNYSRDFNWIDAVRAITIPSFVNSSNILDKYYLTPVLNNKGMNAIDNQHCSPYPQNDALLGSNPDFITVRYTVWAEKDLSLGKSWRIKTPPSSTLYDVMTTVQTLDTTHTVKFNMVDGKPFVRSVSGLAEDPEYDNYWFTYVRTREAAPNVRLLEESPEDVPVEDDDEFILWYRNAIWKTNSTGLGELP